MRTASRHGVKPDPAPPAPVSAAVAARRKSPAAASDNAAALIGGAKHTSQRPPPARVATGVWRVRAKTGSAARRRLARVAHPLEQTGGTTLVWAAAAVGAGRQPAATPAAAELLARRRLLRVAVGLVAVAKRGAFASYRRGGAAPTAVVGGGVGRACSPARDVAAGEHPQKVVGVAYDGRRRPP